MPQSAAAVLSNQPPSRTPGWVSAVVAVGALLTGAGAVIALAHPAMLVAPQAQINNAAEIFAGYFAARNLVLAGALLGLLAIGARRPLGQLLTLVGLIQLVDIAIDCFERRWSILPGVLVLGVLFLFAAARLCGHAFWKRAAWTD